MSPADPLHLSLIISTDSLQLTNCVSDGAGHVGLHGGHHAWVSINNSCAASGHELLEPRLFNKHRQTAAEQTA
jgi:hypothetical protein